MTTYRGRARVLRVSEGGSREYLTATIARTTRARLEDLTARTGIARGRLLDIALATIEACEDCNGQGIQEDARGAVCAVCRGSRVVPAA